MTSTPNTDFVPPRSQGGVVNVDPSKRNILVTSALPYVNNVPHLGNIIGCVLSADVYARYSRQRGYNTVYVCGTDEYGTATETKALQEGVTPKEICDKYHAIHAQVYEWFNIKFDVFGRTSTPVQTEVAQDIFKHLHEGGFTVEQVMTQLHCPQCDKFLADRFVEGTCPKCGYGNARGDQCDGCSQLLDTNELIDPKCKVCGTTPAPRDTEHIFIDLPKIEGTLTQWLDDTMESKGWPENAIRSTKSFLNLGLRPRCITRDLKWGTPVPLDKYASKVFYVWFDAPIGYISITAGYNPDGWEDWWKNDDVEIRQFMGKDNVTFHAIIFPSTLLGFNAAAKEAGERTYNLVHHLSSTDYLQYEDTKFSKSRGSGVFGDTAQTTGIPPAVWRYYLLAQRPESNDSAFLWDEFVARNNNELLANPGNFVNRVLKFVAARCDGKVPASSGLTEMDTAFIAEVNVALTKYIEEMEATHIRSAVATLMALSSIGNKYIHEAEPWKVFKKDADRAATILHVCVNFIHLLSAIIAPIMPSIASNILHQLGLVDDPNPSLDNELHLYIPDVWSLDSPALPAGHTLGTPTVLFATIPESRIDELRAQFAGSQAQQAATAAASADGNAAASSSSAGAPPPGSVVIDKDAVQTAIGAQGAIVRRLKAAAKDAPEDADLKADVDAAIKVLLYLKGVAAEAAGESAGGKKGKKGKKGKGGAGGGKGGKPKNKRGAGTRTPQPKNACPYDLVVGTVVSAVNHPESDKLIIMQVDLGEDEPRQICGGLAKAYTVDSLVGRSFVFLANLRAAKLGGETSDGMLLAAVTANEDGDETIAAVSVASDGVAPGTRVVGDGQVPRILEGYPKLKKKVLKKNKMAVAQDGGVILNDLALATVDGVKVVPDPSVDGIAPGAAVC